MNTLFCDCQHIPLIIVLGFSITAKDKTYVFDASCSAYTASTANIWLVYGEYSVKTGIWYTASIRLVYGQYMAGIRPVYG